MASVGSFQLNLRNVWYFILHGEISGMQSLANLGVVDLFSGGPYNVLLQVIYCKRSLA